MNSYDNFEQREIKCEKCGKKYIQKYIPFANIWSGECECVIAERNADEERRKALKRQSRIDDNIRNSGIPKLYSDSSLDNFEIRQGTERAVKAAKAYVERFPELAEKGKGLIFTGNTGSGKTRLATSIANDLLKNGYTVKFTSFVNLMNRINCSDYGRTEADIISELSSCKLLVIDDICVTDVNDRWKRVLFLIIDNRVNEVKPIIFTSNISETEEIKVKLNEQIFDRITGSCAEIKVLSISFRQKTARQGH